MREDLRTNRPRPSRGARKEMNREWREKGVGGNEGCESPFSH